MPTYRWFEMSPFEIAQGNGEGFTLTPRAGQNPGEFGGFAAKVGTTGEVTGTVSGDRIEFSIVWSDGKTGGYRGWLYPDGVLRGATSLLGLHTVPGSQGFFDAFTGVDDPPDETNVGFWSLDAYRWAR